MASEVEQASASRGRLRLSRITLALGALAAIAAGAYAASWMNSRRYFLIVDATEVRVRKGRMLPIGQEPLRPADPALARAYESFELPGGMRLPRGETVFDDRVELDQALFRILMDAIAYSLAQEDRRTLERTRRYLGQVKAIPGISVSQESELSGLELDALYLEARGLVRESASSLAEAAKKLRLSAVGRGGRHTDGVARAEAVEAAVALLKKRLGEASWVGSLSDARAVSGTATVAGTSTTVGP